MNLATPSGRQVALHNLRPTPHTVAERGSALLIVFVFAAIVAIMLYREMPVTAFEARRQKEELLIDRGNEYKHAVKLYVRKIGQFPPSIEALEDTNRMRFLRHKFDDPITGKDDWRLLHAGPNGIILDSKIPNVNGAPGSNPAAAGSSNQVPGSTAFGNTASNGAALPNTAAGASNSNNPFGSSSAFGSSTSSGSDSFSTIFSAPSNNADANATPTVAGVRQRQPAVAASLAPLNARTAQQTDPNAPVPVVDPQIAGTSTDPQSQMNGLVNNPNPLPGSAGNAQQPTAAVPGSSFGSSSFGSGSFGSTSTTGTNTSGSVPPSGSTFGGSTFGTSTMGKVTGGTGIAGVASIAVGKTIKVVNEQTNFSLWEFYYDMAKEASTALAGAMTGRPTSTGTQSSTSSGSSFGSSSFGNSSFGSSSGFGGSSTTPTLSTTPITPSNPTTPTQPQSQP